MHEDHAVNACVWQLPHFSLLFSWAPQQQVVTVHGQHTPPLTGKGAIYMDLEGTAAKQGKLQAGAPAANAKALTEHPASYKVQIPSCTFLL